MRAEEHHQQELEQQEQEQVWLCAKCLRQLPGPDAVCPKCDTYEIERVH